ncbi:MAG: addiction module toxin, HicA family [Alphaproteobacteria bacterium]|nr:addiction module toxin, HicA family [Alphaproteobacteria bacterium]
MTPTEVLKIARRAGFEVVRQRGSHIVLQHPDGRMAVVAMHKGRDIPIGTLKQIEKSLGLKLS